MCNCPTPEELLRSIDRQIDDRRWQLIGVGFGPDSPSLTPWTYTIGLVEGFGHPELTLVGACCQGCSASILRHLAERVAAGERFDGSATVPVLVDDGRGPAFEVCIRAVEGVPLTNDWFAAWHRYYASKPWSPPALSVLQVVLHDAHGRFPWEPGCDPSTAAVQQLPDRTPWPNRSARRRHGGRTDRTRPRWWDR